MATETKKPAAKKKTTTKTVAAKKSPAKKAPAKKPAAKKVATARKAAPKAAAPKIEAAIDNSSLRPTSFTEISRVHKSAMTAGRSSMVVTATRHGEGTTVLAHMLALRSAESGKKTLLIDLNMRNSFLTSLMGKTPTNWGLAGRTQDDTLEDLVHATEEHPNLHFMGAPSDDMSVKFLRDIQRARFFFDVLERQFDHIVVDTTPVTALNRFNVDSAMLGGAATRTALVILSGKTPLDAIKKSVKILQDAGANLDGVVMNDWQNPSWKERLFKFIRPLQDRTPGLYNWLQHKIIHSKELDY
ncbi:MAG: CpsD/CapB family tyrosine-protein kinase [Pseudomonadota bacterium]|nr:CpsD/CapB family tyrosine-protein kinase [Pseudomonadota bacterium]